MNLQPVTAQTFGSYSPMGGSPAAQTDPAQAGFQAAQPFEAYLLSLSDPASQALAAKAGAGATTASGSGSAASTLVATAAASVLGAASAASPVPQPDGTAQLVADAANAYAQASLGSAAEPDTGTAAAVEPDTGAQDAADAAKTAESLQSDQLATDRLTAANAAQVAASAAANALVASDAANAVDAGSPGAAVDATAKFMGAGAMGLPDRAMSAYQAIQDAVPAVSGILSASAMAANTSSNPQSRMFGQTGAGSAASNPSAVFALDLLS